MQATQNPMEKNSLCNKPLLWCTDGLLMTLVDASVMPLIFSSLMGTLLPYLTSILAASVFTAAFLLEVIFDTLGPASLWILRLQGSKKPLIIPSGVE